MGGKMPKADNAADAARVTGDYSKEAALTKIKADRPWLQSNPYGSVTWREGPNGQWISEESNTPTQQQILERNQTNELGRSNLGNLAGRAYANELGFGSGANYSPGPARINPYLSKIVSQPTVATPQQQKTAQFAYRNEPNYKGATATGKALIDRLQAMGMGQSKTVAQPTQLTPAQVKANAAWQAKADAWSTAEAKKNEPKYDQKAINAKQAELLKGIPTYASFGALPTADNATRERVEDALYARSQSRLNPEFNEQSRTLNNRLVQMGFMPASDASTKALESFGRTRNDAYANARNDAIAGGGVEQSRLFDMAMTRRDAQVAERSQQLGEKRSMRGDRLQEFLSLMNGASSGNFSGSGSGSGRGYAQPGGAAQQADTPDFAAAAQADNQSAQARYNAQQQKKAQIASAAIATSSALASAVAAAVASGVT